MFVPSSTESQALIYYRQRILDARMVMRTCTQCGRVFFAPDTRTSLCSERCRKASKKAARRGFDEKAKKLDYEMAYEREYMFWHNRIRKLKKENAPQEKVERAGEELKQFCREALYHKWQVKEGKLSSGQFISWLIAQEHIIQKNLWRRINRGDYNTCV